MSSTMNKLVNLHKTIKQLRLSAKLTQKQVAAQVGITYQSYQAYETGLTVPTLANFLKLCEIFDVTPDELLEY